MLDSIPKFREDFLTGRLIHLRREVDLQVAHHLGLSPALVFLHGGLGNRFNWRCQYEFFVTQNREILAYDLAGHGQSTPYPRYSLGRHRRDLTRLLQYLQIQSPVLCCHSYGVPLGLELARRQQVSALILIAGGTHDLDPWWEIPLMKFFQWGGRYLYHLSLVRSLTNRFSTVSHTETTKQFLAECPVPTNLEPYKGLEIFWNYDFFERYHCGLNFEVPVLVISGGRDPMFTKAMGDALASHFKTKKHLHLPNASHLLMAEYPEIVNEAIAFWLTEIL
jgi:pimeloyl-ACP methyl ester carboxylesterase